MYYYAILNKFIYIYVMDVSNDTCWIYLPFRGIIVYEDDGSVALLGDLLPVDAANVHQLHIVPHLVLGHSINQSLKQPITLTKLIKKLSINQPNLPLLKC